MTKLMTMSEIETLSHEEYAYYLAYGDEIYEELDAATKNLLELTCVKLPNSASNAKSSDDYLLAN